MKTEEHMSINRHKTAAIVEENLLNNSAVEYDLSVQMV